MKYLILNSRLFDFRTRHLVLWLGVAALATGQDAWFAFFKNTSFYWSESLLYKLYWLLFIPQMALISYLVKKWPVTQFIHYNTGKHLLIASAMSLIQIAAFSGLVALLSGSLLGYTFQFNGVFRESLADNFAIGLSMYGLMLFMIKPVSIKNQGLETVAKAHQFGAKTIDYKNVFLVKKGTKTIRVAADSLDWIGTEDSYSVLHRADQKWLVSDSLNQLEKQLDPQKFVRTHRACIVNVARVQQVISRRTGDYDVRLQDGRKLRLSRHYLSKAKEVLLS